MRIEILNNEGRVVNTILATGGEAERLYPGTWRIAETQEVEGTLLHKPWEWLIDIGSFFDRFGATKMAVLTSSDAGVQAILKDTQVREWIDLKHPDVASSIAYISTKVPSVTQELQESILDTPVAEIENLALRKLYFS